MLNRPTAPELIAAVRAFLETEVAPTLSGATQFNLRIAGNVLAIVERELSQRTPAEAAEAERLRALLGDRQEAPASELASDDGAATHGLADLNQRLVAAIRAGAFDPAAENQALLDHLRATTTAKLAIDNPRYR